MNLHHIALWTTQLEVMRQFYCDYLGGTTAHKYVNESKGFESYFVRFEGGNTTLELMQRKDVNIPTEGERLGFCHIAFGLESKEAVLTRTEQLRAAGVTVASEPRTTGDGMFESVVLDPDGNRIELVY